jgi:protein tyrosine phosphatase (PTP) superfamily phosphohydrolase (DUF442 family)
MSLFKKTTKKFCVIVFLFFFIGLSSQMLTESTWFTSSFSYFFSKNNFHIVKDGQIYRSASLNEKELKDLIKTYGIKTVVDLRYTGDKPEKYGFSEKEVVENLNVTYEWIPFVGTRTNQKDSFENLIKLAQKSTLPVLIHCSSGTHRTGVASAIWLMIANNESPDIAGKQLSTKYGYFYGERRIKSFFIGHQTIDAIIWRYLDKYHKTNISFIDWIKDQGDKQ